MPEEPLEFQENPTNNDNRKTFFCSSDTSENTLLFGWCIGKIVYKWIGGVLTVLGSGTTIAMNFEAIVEFLNKLV